MTVGSKGMTGGTDGTTGGTREVTGKTAETLPKSASPTAQTVRIRMISSSGVYPAYETPGSAGMDVRAWLTEPVTLRPGERALIPTGLFMEIEPGYEVQLRARSGLAIRNGICLANGIGTIDSDYRGEVQVALINLGQEPFTVHSGDRIAQMVIAAYLRGEIEPAEELSESGRGSGGFGSTGV